MKRSISLLNIVLILSLLVTTCGPPTVEEVTGEDEVVTTGEVEVVKEVPIPPIPLSDRAEAWTELPSEESVLELPSLAWEDIFLDCEPWPDDPYELGQDIGDFLAYTGGEPNPWDNDLYDGLQSLEMILDPEGSGLSQFDLDEDGFIFLEEVQQLAQESDADGDGVLELSEIGDDDFRRLAKLYDINRGGAADLNRLILIDVADEDEEVDIADQFHCTWGWEEWEPPEGWMDLLDGDGDGEMEITPDILVGLELYPIDEAEELAEELLPFTKCGSPVDIFEQMLEQNLHPAFALVGEIGDYGELGSVRGRRLLAVADASPAAPDPIEEIDRQIMTLVDEMAKLEREIRLHTDLAVDSAADMRYWRNQISDRIEILKISAEIYWASDWALNVALFLSIAKLVVAVAPAVGRAALNVAASEGGKQVILKGGKQWVLLIFGDATVKAATKEATRQLASQIHRQRAQFLRLVMLEMPKESGRAALDVVLSTIAREGSKQIAYDTIQMQVKTIKELDDYLRKKVGNSALRTYVRELNRSGLLYTYHGKQLRIKSLTLLLLENMLTTLREARTKLGGGPNLTGLWQTNYGLMRLNQIGTEVTGTYEHEGGQIKGAFDGERFVFEWWEKAPGQGYEKADKDQRGDGYFELSSNKNVLTGEWKHEGQTEWSAPTWTCRRKWTQRHQIGVRDLIQAFRWDPLPRSKK